MTRLQAAQRPACSHSVICAFMVQICVHVAWPFQIGHKLSVLEGPATETSYALDEMLMQCLQAHIASVNSRTAAQNIFRILYLVYHSGSSCPNRMTAEFFVFKVQLMAASHWYEKQLLWLVQGFASLQGATA